MYLDHFGLQTRPFRPTPDPSCYYPATGHEQALAGLLHAVEEDEGLVLVTGAPGTGKTLLCHRLLDRLGAEAATAYLTHGHYADRLALLQALAYDLGVPMEGHGEQALRLALAGFLVERHAAGQRTVAVVDEAHLLTPALLEELRLLGNLEHARGKAFQAVLVGLPGLLDALAEPALAGVRQRLAVRIVLEPLGLHEAADYLVHQVRVAGGKPGRVLTDEAAEVLARETQGVPRLLNQAAHRALALACEVGAEQVDAEVALESLSRLGLGGEAGGEEGPGLQPATLDDTEDETDPDDPLPRRNGFGPPRRPA